MHSRSRILLKAEGYHLTIVLAEVSKIASGSIHPPYVLLFSGDFSEVDIHVARGVIIDHQIVVAARGDESVVLPTIV